MSIYKFAPKTVSIYSSEHGALHDVCVEQYIVYAAHSSRTLHCPIRKDVCALEMKTAFGSRWYGFKNASISSHLRVVCELLPGQENDEVVMKWENTTDFV